MLLLQMRLAVVKSCSGADWSEMLGLWGGGTSEEAFRWDQQCNYVGARVEDHGLWVPRTESNVAAWATLFLAHSQNTSTDLECLAVVV